MAVSAATKAAVHSQCGRRAYSMLQKHVGGCTGEHGGERGQGRCLHKLGGGAADGWRNNASSLHCCSGDLLRPRVGGHATHSAVCDDVCASRCC